MKVIILGARGMLGSELLKQAREAGLDAHGWDLPEINLAAENPGLSALPAADWAVNCAAYTDVDGAEAAPDAAFAVNARGVERVARWCRERGTKLLHISTDYVFSGDQRRPYREDDPTGPINVYGRSKLEGERAVAAAGIRHLVVRTQSLFGPRGRHFVGAILRRLRSSPDPVPVVSDQVSSPTCTLDLAAAILRLMEVDAEGIVHVSASGECSWYEFACAIAERTGAGGRIVPVTSAQYPRPARRPAYSVLDKTLYTRLTGRPPPAWREGLERYVAESGETF